MRQDVLRSIHSKIHFVNIKLAVRETYDPIVTFQCTVNNVTLSSLYVWKEENERKRGEKTDLLEPITFIHLVCLSFSFIVLIYESFNGYLIFVI